MSFRADNEPAIFADQAPGPPSCPDIFALPGGGRGMWFHYEDELGGSHIGRARLTELGWSVDARPALSAAEQGWRGVGCTSTLADEQGLRLWLGAEDGQGRRGIFSARSPDGRRIVIDQTAALFDEGEEGKLGLSDPSVAYHQGVHYLYARRGTSRRAKLSLHTSADGVRWERKKMTVTPPIGSSRMDYGSPHVRVSKGQFLLWLLMGRPSRNDDQSSSDPDKVHGSGLLFVSTPDPTVIDLSHRPTALKPGRVDYKSLRVDGPCAVYEGGELALYFHARGDGNPGAIGRAFSAYLPTSEQDAAGADATDRDLQAIPKEPTDSAHLLPIAGGELLLLGTIQHSMLHIPAGEFVMGSPLDEEGRQLDEPQHHVTLTRPFLLGDTEVTQAMYAAVMGSNPAENKGARYPVEQVSWVDAVQFCNALSALAGLQPVYQGSGNDVTWDQQANGFRLPSEAEWEYAARAGVPDHAWAALGSVKEGAWFRINSDGHSHPVAQLLPNPWGLYDMNGNVYEWVWDRKGRYRGDAIDPVESALDTPFRCERGGSFRNGHNSLRNANRGRMEFDGKSYNLGFRLARNADGIEPADK